MLPVDPVGQFLDFFGQVAVNRQMGAARRSDLEEVEGAAELGMLLQEAIQGEQAFRDALGVIEAEAELFAQPSGPAFPRAPQIAAGQVGIHTDGEGAHLGFVAAARDRKRLPVPAALQGAIDTFEEVVAVVLGVEAEQVVAEQAVQNLPRPRADQELVHVRPGDVPEVGDGQIGPGFLEQTGQQGEVIILDEDQGRTVLRFL